MRGIWPAGNEPFDRYLAMALRSLEAMVTTAGQVDSFVAVRIFCMGWLWRAGQLHGGWDQVAGHDCGSVLGWPKHLESPASPRRLPVGS